MKRPRKRSLLRSDTSASRICRPCQGYCGRRYSILEMTQVGPHGEWMCSECVNEKNSMTGEVPPKSGETWHPLPQLIGNAITKQSSPSCGGFIAEYCDGKINVWYEIARGDENPDVPNGLDAKVWKKEDDLTGEMVAYKKLGEIEEPPVGWEDSFSEIKGSHWNGYR